MQKLPKTHIKKIASAIGLCNGHNTVTLWKIGIAHHNNRYTPETAYMITIDDQTRGIRFTGKKAERRAQEGFAECAALIMK